MLKLIGLDVGGTKCAVILAKANKDNISIIEKVSPKSFLGTCFFYIKLHYEDLL